MIREEFRQRFPKQAEHIMRLIAERLHGVIVVKPDDMSDPATWIATPTDIRELSQALYYMNVICKDHPYDDHQ
jgi:hypothetical protein